jgi:hypothetical protein
MDHERFAAITGYASLRHLMTALPLQPGTAAVILPISPVGLLWHVSVISVFDGDPRTLFDGWVGLDRVRDVNECAVVLAAVKDASRR